MVRGRKGCEGARFFLTCDTNIIKNQFGITGQQTHLYIKDDYGQQMHSREAKNIKARGVVG